MSRTERTVDLFSKLFPFDPPVWLANFLKPRLEAALLFVPPSSFAKFAMTSAVLPMVGEILAMAKFPQQFFLLTIALLLPVQVFPWLLLAYRRSWRRRSVEGELPFVAMLLFILSHESFANLPDAFKRIEQLGPETFPAFFAEAQNLAKNLAYGTGPELDATEETFRYHPDPQLRELIHGYLTTLVTGRDVHEFVREESERLLAVQEERWRSFSGLLSTMTEVSFIFLAVFPVGIQMIAGTFSAGSGSALLLVSMISLSLVAFALLLWMDLTQPLSHDQRYPPRLLFALLLAIFATLGVYYAGLIDPVEATALALALFLAYATHARGFFVTLKAGEKEAATMLHDLAELARAGMELPAAMARLLERPDGFPSVRESLSTFSRMLSLGQPPLVAMKRVHHPSWLVRVSFALLATTFETGGGYEQLDKLSLSFRRVSDSRRSIQASVLPFAFLAVAVPAISAASLWFLRSMQSLGPGLPFFAIQGGTNGAGGSILATSILTGLLVSKAYSQSLRNLWGVPPVLLSALLSFLFFGSQ